MKDLSGKECGLKQGPEQEAKKSEEQKLEETLNFFKIAFCIDGEAKLLPLLTAKDKFDIKAVIELNDSKRGKIFVGILENKK